MISKSDFIKGNFKKRNSDIEKHPVNSFLKKNNKKAFTVKEIVKATKMIEETVRSMLRNLKKKGLVWHKSPYFIYIKPKK